MERSGEERSEEKDVGASKLEAFQCCGAWRDAADEEAAYYLRSQHGYAWFI